MFQIKLEFESVGFLKGEGKTRVPGEKNLGARERTNNKLNPHMASRPGFEPGPLWWEARALITAPPLLSKEFGIQDCLGLPFTRRVVSYCRVLCVRDPYPPGLDVE